MNRSTRNRYICHTFALIGLFCATAVVLPARVSEPSQFVSLSARGQVGTGQDVLIGGFVIAGTAPKQVLLRVAGPALDSFGVTSRLSATKVSIYSGSREIASNQGGAAASSADIALAVAKLGTFPFPANSLNSALLVSLDPGAYTAVVSSTDGSRGIALLEVYELPASSSAVLTSENQTKIQQLVDAAIRNYEIPGIMYSVKFLGEQPWTQARGVRSRTTGAALQPDDYFRIGSASKTFTGMATLKMIQENKLKLDATLDRLLPAEVLNNYPKNQITVRMLLSHTSGINSYTNFIEDWFMPYITNRTRVWTDLELVQLVNAKFKDPELGQIATPGTVWAYSNTNTVILSLILERLQNKPIRQIIQESFLTPLGLNKTIYPAPGQSVMPEPYARGYMNWANYVSEPSLPNTDLDVSVYDPSGVGAAGAIISTTGDLARWMESMANADNGSPSYRRGHLDWKFFTGFGAGSYTPGYAQSSYGLQMAHEPDSNNTADYWIVGHRGQISGYDTAMMYLPEYDAAIVVACTRSLKNAPGFPTNAATVALNGMVKILFPKLIADSQARIIVAPESAPVEQSIDAGQERAESLRTRAVRTGLPLSEY
jgi:D-alanyl-D-alanine carboxypeptidase